MKDVKKRYGKKYKHKYYGFTLKDSLSDETKSVLIMIEVAVKLMREAGLDIFMEVTPSDALHKNSKKQFSVGLHGFVLKPEHRKETQ